jgi:hypothetical protein
VSKGGCHDFDFQAELLHERGPVPTARTALVDHDGFALEFFAVAVHFVFNFGDFFSDDLFRFGFKSKELGDVAQVVCSLLYAVEVDFHGGGSVFFLHHVGYVHG